MVSGRKSAEKILVLGYKSVKKDFGIRRYFGKINFGIRRYFGKINFGIRDFPCDSDRFQLDYVLLSRRHFHTIFPIN